MLVWCVVLCQCMHRINSNAHWVLSTRTVWAQDVGFSNTLCCDDALHISTRMLMANLQWAAVFWPCSQKMMGCRTSVLVMSGCGPDSVMSCKYPLELMTRLHQSSCKDAELSTKAQHGMFCSSHGQWVPRKWGENRRCCCVCTQNPSSEGVWGDCYCLTCHLNDGQEDTLF